MSKEWKLVPVEPTDDMKEAGAPSCEYTGTVCAALCYEAMIAAAPEAPRQDNPVLMKIAADLACRRPLSRLHRICEAQGRISTENLADDVDKCGDLLANIALDIRREITKSAPLSTEHSGVEVVSQWSDFGCVNLRINGQLRMYVESCKPEPIAELQSIVEQQKSLIASLRAELTESYSITGDTLRTQLDEREALLLKCMHAFNHVVGLSDQATRSAWYENFLKPVSGAVMVHLSNTGSNPFDKPAESGASE